MEAADVYYRYQGAAIFLQEGKNNDRFDTHPTRQTVRWYLIAHSTFFYILDMMAALFLLALGLTEKPASGEVPEDDTLYLPVIVHGTLEILSLSVIATGMAIRLKWQGPKLFFSHKRTLLKVVVLSVVFVEAIVVLARSQNHVRVTRALRPLFLIDSHYCFGVRRVLRQILLSLPPILDMLFLLLFIMVIFAMLGFYLFSDNEKDEFFNSFWRSFISLFVLLTTANYPDVMMPSYQRSRWAVIYFGVYIAVVLYFLMNLLLAVVYDTFTNIEKNKFRKLFLHKRQAVRQAYKLLCSESPPHWISLSKFIGLMSFYKPKSTLVEKYLIFKSLDTSRRRQLSLDEFYHIFENSEMKWKQITEHYQQWFICLKSWNCLYRTVKGIRWLITQKAFEYVIYAVIIANGISFIVDIVVFSNTPQNERANKREELMWYHIVFISIYAAEAALKLIGLGVRKYFLSGWNMFDFFVTLAGFIGAVSTSFSFIVCLRPLRLLLLFKLKQRYRDVFETMGVLLPRMTRVALVILLLYYSFGIIGIECFSGLELKNCCQNTSWEEQYKEDGYYYLNNFNDLLHSYVTLFELTVVNNWMIIMEGIVYVTSDWARIYFMSFYIVTMVVMTIIVAFILEAFLFRIEYRKEHPTDEKEDMKIKKEITVTYEELLDLGEEFVQDLQPNQPVRYIGKRSKTKMDLSIKMYADEVKQWIQNERIIDMSETYAQFEVMEDVPRMSPTNTPSSPDSSNVSRNGQVTEELEIRKLNSSVDKDDEL
ncbi:two pore calcium channel protein 1-like [Orbicella faveolata]|uniref:two pore calcium channel protein 1-like n=1 Tax=Orbicella faveolata TaxID=48498 RepID=UPI0009E3F7E4|nr:two pore calcium channel protein 1-like [Orbicella faveolata]XP_020622395.1 two pore calcium channel protein 1-like [Orbicella faveolata]